MAKRDRQPDPMDTPARIGGREVVRLAPDAHLVAALGTLCRHVADPDERRELALMLGYGEPEARERYEAGLRAILGSSAALPGPSPTPESRAGTACAGGTGPSGVESPPDPAPPPDEPKPKRRRPRKLDPQLCYKQIHPRTEENTYREPRRPDVETCHPCLLDRKRNARLKRKRERERARLNSRERINDQ